MDAAQALADLTEISAQIQAAVLAQADGSVVASTFREEHKGKELAGAASELVTAARESGEPSGQPLVQLQAVTPQGSVFVVRDESHLVAAVTGAKPTVGLVFYDLKTCLRMLEREEPSKATPAKAKPKAEGKTKVGKATSRRSPAKKDQADGGS
jgi:predicted regulator of Ras-like GTPase activity (Roadblock/LC7/MglB family)